MLTKRNVGIIAVSNPCEAVSERAKSFLCPVKVRLRRRMTFPIPGSHPLHEPPPVGPLRTPFTELLAPETLSTEGLAIPARRRGFSRRWYICPAHVIRAFCLPGSHVPGAIPAEGIAALTDDDNGDETWSHVGCKPSHGYTTREPFAYGAYDYPLGHRFLTFSF